jgi:hypothetical protein
MVSPSSLTIITKHREKVCFGSLGEYLEFDFGAAFMKACFGLLGFFLLEEAIRD